MIHAKYVSSQKNFFRVSLLNILSNIFIDIINKVYTIISYS